MRRWTIAVALVATFCVLTARGEPDWFGLGDGGAGALTVDAGTSVVVNAYGRLTASADGGSTQLSVSPPTVFTAGDLVLVLQTTGLSPTPDSGVLAKVSLDGGPVGRWEFARLGAVDSSGNMTLLAPLLYSYEAGATQIIKVPQYSSVNIRDGGSIVAAPWDGGTGGVVAFLVSGQLALDPSGAVVAAGAGYNGGSAAPGNTAVNCSNLDELAPSGASKGEGVAGTRVGVPRTGRGNVANGGGGGVCAQSGGGGGGNGGFGGLGGWSQDSARDVGGLGGAPLDFSMLDHLLPGGGGGSGHASGADGGGGGGGGAGGGIIFVRAGSVLGNGSFNASGAPGGSGNSAAAGGGGGAGGSIYLRVAGQVSCGSIVANGGTGGNTPLFSGPGGGGGGGRVLFQANSVQGMCSKTVNAGWAGTQLVDGGSNYGAEPAMEGAIYDGISTTLPGGFPLLSAPNIQSPANNSVTNDSTPDVRGSAQADSQVILYLDGVELGRATAVGSSWSYALDAGLPDGLHQLSAVAEYQAVQSPRGGVAFSVDTRPPSQPLIMSPSPGAWVRSATPTFTGLAEPGTMVVLDVFGFPGTTLDAGVDGDGGWAVTPSAPLADSFYIASARAVDLAGNYSISSPNIPFSVDSVKPNAPQIFLPASGAAINTTTPVISGVAEPSSHITIRINGRSGDAGFADGLAGWRFQSWPLDAGVQQVEVVAVDRAGNASDAGTSSFLVDVTPPLAPVIQSPPNNAVVDGGVLIVDGWASEFGDVVFLYADGADAGFAFVNKVDRTNVWYLALTSIPPLSEGTHSLAAVEVDSAGNMSAPSTVNTFTVDLTPPASPTISNPDGGQKIGGRELLVTGTAEMGSTVNVFFDSTFLGQDQANIGGLWSVPLRMSLANGGHTLWARATDMALNSSLLSPVINLDVDAIPPLAPVIKRPSDGAYTTAFPTISGESEPRSVVTVQKKLNDGGYETYAANADDAGYWSLTFGPVGEGEYRVRAYATDELGNKGSVSDEVRFAIDKTPPPPPGVSFPKRDGYVSGPNLLVTGTAEPTSDVSIYVDNGLLNRAVAVPSSGNWSIDAGDISALTETLHTLYAYATDPAGNDGGTTAVPFYVDRTPPDAGFVTVPANPTRSPDAVFDFNASEPMVRYEYMLDDGGFEGDGGSHVEMRVSEGSHILWLRAIDRAGNIGYKPQGHSWRVDMTPPGLSVEWPPEGQPIPEDTPIIRGKVELGSSLSVSVDDVPVAVSLDGESWRLEPSPTLSMGGHTVTASALDEAGNRSDVTRKFSVDTFPPVTAIAEKPPLLSGKKQPLFRFLSTEKGVTYQCSLDGSPPHDCGADSLGYTVLAVEEGPHVLQVWGTDRAGNVEVTPVEYAWEVRLPEPPALDSPSSGAKVWTPTRLRGTVAHKDYVVQINIMSDGNLVDTGFAKVTDATPSPIWEFETRQLPEGSYTVSGGARTLDIEVPDMAALGEFVVDARSGSYFRGGCSCSSADGSPVLGFLGLLALALRSIRARRSSRNGGKR